ncbi:MAG TPA: tyrosine-type recombinase/integrase [Pyrinomonadaceae bacterium]|jgi:integrase|nr:tyrosine-type recombinase/integrase [Pyrinomonadaceae bacterium]
MDAAAGFRVFEFVVPAAFRTALDRGNDAKEDSELLISGAGTVAESDQNPSEEVVGTNSSIAFSDSGRVLPIDTRRNQLFTGAIGIASLAQRKYEFPNQWIDNRYCAGAPLTSHAVVKNLKHYAQIAKLKGFHLHQTRHTFARIFAEESGSIMETQEVLDHVNVATTRAYMQRIAIKRDKFSASIKRRITPGQ